MRELLGETDSEAMHQMWLASDVAALFNEAISFPYTSLKYHTLLVAALLDNYLDGHAFADLSLVVDDAETIVPRRTVYAGAEFALRIDATVADRTATHLGRRPRRSWASTWSQLPRHPLGTSHSKLDIIFDANLRRIRAWSTALQYLEDFTNWADRHIEPY